jgi:hypothetical protein
MKIFICFHKEDGEETRERLVQANSKRHARRRYRKAYLPNCHPTFLVICQEASKERMSKNPIIDLLMAKERKLSVPNEIVADKICEELNS